MKTGVSILAGLLAGVLVAVGILAAIVLVGPDPAGARPTPTPTLVPSAAITPPPSASVAPPPSPSVAPSVSASVPPVSPGASASFGSATAPRIGQPASSLVMPQVGGGTIDLTVSP